MGKNKLGRFAEMETFTNVVQPHFSEIMNTDHELKGNWNQSFFKNDNPLVLELGCGKGEYTVGLASRFPGKNFIGVDIKGARMWRGAKLAIENNLANAGFLRTRIEFISSFFAPGEVSEIWITFPDPQLKKRRNKKRLTHPRFLNMYRRFLTSNGIIHLKTDNRVLYEYTLHVIRYNQIKPVVATGDLYHSPYDNETFGIKTFYEQMFLEQEMPIHYLKFVLPPDEQISDIPDE